MAALRSSSPAPARGRSPVYRWAIGSALACLLLYGFWSGTQILRSRLAPAPFTAAATVKLNQQVAALPATVLSPLSREWQALNLDMEEAAEFLLSSVP